MNFQEWLEGEIAKSGLSYSELGRRGGISHSRISQIINGDGLPGEKFCLAMAKALDLPPETVLKRAGYQVKMASATKLIVQPAQTNRISYAKKRPFSLGSVNNSI